MQKIILFIEKLTHLYLEKNVNYSKKCITVKEANKIKLQNFLKKIKSNVNTNHIIQYSTMRALDKELKNYYALLNESKNQNLNENNLWYLKE